MEKNTGNYWIAGGNSVATLSSAAASPTIERAIAWLEKIAATLRDKNAAYGDSAANPLRIFSNASPIEQVLVRIDDKLSRIARGAGRKDVQEDAIADLVGYLAILSALDGAAQERTRG